MNNNAAFVGFITIMRKETMRILRIWPQTLVPPIITMTLYYIIFGNLIGSRIGDMNGFDYMTFVVPGLVMMSIITNSYTNVVASFFSTKFQKNIEEILISPMPPMVIIFGYVSGGVFRGLLVGILVTIISFLFTSMPFHSPVIIFSIVILTSILFSLGGFLNALFATKFDDIAIFPTFILTPLTYLGGVFYSIDLLPPFWQKVSMINPVLYMVNAFRYGFLGKSDISITFAFIFLIVMIIIVLTLSTYLLRKGHGLKT